MLLGSHANHIHNHIFILLLCGTAAFEAVSGSCSSVPGLELTMNLQDSSGFTNRLAAAAASP
jgi:hypothetical protein